MVAGQTTGTYTFGSGLYASDMVLEVFERIGWRSASLTADMLISAQRSFNFVQARWSNFGVNLWEVELRQVLLEQGESSITLPANTISVLPAAFIRSYPLSVNNNLAAPFTTTVGSATVTITQANNGQAVGSIINVSTPVAVGGIVLYGFYSVVALPTASTYTIVADSAATSSVTGGTVPTFTTTVGSANIVVALTNQPFGAGQYFDVQVPVTVGGHTLGGTYPIVSATTNSFTINITQTATTAQTVSMNTALPQIQVASQGTIMTDRVMFPLGRSEYTSLAVKSPQGPPSSFWFDRLTIPTVSFWPVPDGHGPYQFNYYALTQLQDASVQDGAVVDIPYRFMEAYAAACAAHLAMKWRPDIAPALMAYSKEVWIEASDADREEVSFYMAPDFGGYYR